MLIVPKIYVEYSTEENQIEKVELTELLNQLTSLINHYKTLSHQTVQSKNSEPLISISELAEKLNKSESTIHNWKRHGLIPFKRIGRSVFFLEGEVKDALNSILPQNNNKLYL
jgi:predicted DNA-binding transcriptional regulator AlpA